MNTHTALAHVGPLLPKDVRGVSPIQDGGEHVALEVKLVSHRCNGVTAVHVSLRNDLYDVKVFVQDPQTGAVSVRETVTGVYAEDLRQCVLESIGRPFRVVRLTLPAQTFQRAVEASADGDDSLCQRLSKVTWLASGDGDAYVHTTTDMEVYRDLAGVEGVDAKDVSADYVFGFTPDEPSYDGFGTLHLRETHGYRTVAVRREHLDWQLSRYDRFDAVEGVGA